MGAIAYMRREAAWSRAGAVVVLAWLVGLPLYFFWPNFGDQLLGVGVPLHMGRPRLHTGGQLLAGAAVFLAGYGLGRPLARALLPAWRGWRGELQACALGLGCLSVVDLVLTAGGLYRPVVVIAVVVLFAAVGCIWLARSGRGVQLRAPTPDGALLGGLLLIVLGFAAVGALAPEIQYDALWYHVGFPEEWLRTGHLTYFPWQFVSVYPFANELLYGNAIALAGPIAAKVVDLGFGILLIAATIDLGQRLFTRRAAVFGALCLAVGPTVLWSATTANTDLAVATFVVLAVDVAVARTEHPDRRTALACGLLIGFGLATKLTAALALPAVGLLIFAGPRGRSVRARAADLTLMALVSLLPVLPYLIRAAILTGDPVFPNLYNVFRPSPSLFSPEENAGLAQFLRAFGEGHGPLRFLTLPWDMTMHAAAFGGTIGLLFLVGVPLSLTRRLNRMQVLVGLGAAGFTLLWFWPGATLQIRFLIPAAALLGPFVGAGFERAAGRLGREWRPLRAATLLLGAGLVAVTLPPFLRYQEHDHKRSSEVVYQTPLPYFLANESPEEYLSAHIPTYGAERRLASLAAPGDRVLVITAYDLDQVDSSVEHIPYDWAGVYGIYGDDRQALSTLHKFRIRFVLWGRDGLTWGGRLDQAGFKRRYLRLVYKDAHTALYELRAAPTISKPKIEA